MLNFSLVPCLAGAMAAYWYLTQEATGSITVTLFFQEFSETFILNLNISSLSADNMLDLF